MGTIISISMRTWPGAGLLAGISPRLGRNCEPSRLGQALCVYSGIVRRLSSHAGISTPSFARRISRRSSSSVHDELNEERNELSTGPSHRPFTIQSTNPQKRRMGSTGKSFAAVLQRLFDFVNDSPTCDGYQYRHE